MQAQPSGHLLDEMEVPLKVGLQIVLCRFEARLC